MHYTKTSVLNQTKSKHDKLYSKPNGKHRLHLDHHQPNRYRNGPIFQTENVKLDRAGVVDFGYDSIFDWHLCCLDSSRALMVVVMAVPMAITVFGAAVLTSLCVFLLKRGIGRSRSQS